LSDSLKVILLDELVQIDAEQFKDNYKVFSKDEVVQNSDDVVLVLFVIQVEQLEYLQLHARLVLELLLITHKFEGNQLVSLMVETLKRLAKAATSQRFEHLVSVVNVVFHLSFVVTLVVVEAVVEDVHLVQSLQLLD
jgi:hypothetical protein